MAGCYAVRSNKHLHSVFWEQIAFAGRHTVSRLLDAVQVSVRAVFSKYSITPARALNFGPVIYNSTAGPRTLEVTNVGEVPVNLRLFDPVKGLVSCCCHLCFNLCFILCTRTTDWGGCPPDVFCPFSFCLCCMLAKCGKALLIY